MVSTRRTSATASPPAHQQPQISKTPFSMPQTKTPFSMPQTKTVSASLKSVLLDDWWLFKAQGNALAVEGFVRSQRAAVRTFSSAAISKRHTATILETVDGIIVTLCGHLNISRTNQNGFPPEVYHRYLLGFPFDWEEQAAGLLHQGYTDTSASAKNSSQKSSEDGDINPLPFSAADVRATVTRDFIMSCVGDSEQLKTIFDDILRTSGDNVFGDTTPQINSNMEDRHPIENMESEGNETPILAKNVQIDDENNKSTDVCLKGSQKLKKGMLSGKHQTSTKPVPTRSSARLKNLKYMQDASLAQ